MILRMLQIASLVALTVAHSNLPPLGQQPDLQGHHPNLAQKVQQQQQQQGQPPPQQQQQQGQPPVQQHHQQHPQPPAHSFGAQGETYQAASGGRDRRRREADDERAAAVPLLQDARQRQQQQVGRHRVDQEDDSHDHATPEGQAPPSPPPAMAETELEDMIDNIMKDDDFNGDGYIDYGEFLKAQGDREAKAQQEHDEQPPPQA